MTRQNIGLFFLLISVIFTLSKDTNFKLNNSYEDIISYLTDNHKIISNKEEENLTYLEIPKIKFIKALNPHNQNVDLDLWVAKESIFPDSKNSNVIIAGHSGNGNNAYFHNLYKLSFHDLVKLYYKDKIYSYQIFKISTQAKTGTLDILKTNKNIITLITCTKNDDFSQTIYYGELKSVKNM